VKYFSCDKNCGVFVKREAICKVIRRARKNGTSHSEAIRVILAQEDSSMQRGWKGIRHLLENMEAEQEEMKNQPKFRSKRVKRTKKDPSTKKPRSKLPRMNAKKKRQGKHVSPLNIPGSPRHHSAMGPMSPRAGMPATWMEPLAGPDDGDEDPEILKNQKKQKRRRQTWTGNRDSTADLIDLFETATEEEWAQSWANEELEASLQDNPILWCLSADARAELNNPADVARMLHDIERCITLIDRYIPEVTNIMEKQLGEKVLMTNVIQELLKRAQKRELSHKIRNDFTSARDISLETQEEFTVDDIESMVQLMSWIRNNIAASAVTDENDAKMASLGAKEVKHELSTILKKHHSEVSDKTRSFREEHEKRKRPNIADLFN